MPKTFLVQCIFIAASLLACVPTPVAAQAVASPYQVIDDAVAAEMKRQQIVGAAVGIISDSKLVYAQGYGFANVGNQTEVSSDTIFNWASNSKPLMAIAAMQLVQKRQLNLDQPIVSYIPSLPDQMKQITTRQLLSHQSGIPHYSNGKVIPSGKTIEPLAELDPLNSLNRFLLSPLIFQPGTKTEYSSYAYVLLSAVVQAAGKSPIEQQIQDRIVKPLRLNSFQMDMPFQQQRDWTKAYVVFQNGTPAEVPDYAHFWKHGAGGYKSNVKDFAKFGLALASAKLIHPQTTAEMWTAQKTKTGATSTYGLGVVVSGSGQTLKISHNGSQDETRTRMVFYPNQKHGIVVMCNTRAADPGKISTAIYSALNRR
ncbi:MAG: serine hydrolase domain-containing protein [Fuerstiella sp.]